MNETNQLQIFYIYNIIDSMQHNSCNPNKIRPCNDHIKLKGWESDGSKYTCKLIRVIKKMGILIN